MDRLDLYIPKDLNDLLLFLQRDELGSRVIAGGTDLVPRLRRGDLVLPRLVDLSGLSDLRYIRKERGEVRIGSMTTIADATSSRILGRKYEAFQQAARLFGSNHTLNMATVGGNVAAAVSASDFLVIFLALDAKVRLLSALGERILRLEDFVLGKRTLDLKKGEIISEISFPEIPDQATCSFQKVGRRQRVIVSLVSLALYLQLDLNSKRIKEIRIAMNRLRGKHPARAKMTESILNGKSFASRTLNRAISALEGELSLTSDFRATAEYRKSMAGVLLGRAWKDCLARMRVA
jgi:CO/xanthine dehydrogenase FAD-binding subunit